ncbi:MAG: inorganic phosphate transporter [Alistipes sp.]|nr:inorganic phosphate transporter [Alistipes sp.]MBR1994218.1 inorganic phosphate transporter [Alistipes sp.]
MSILYTIIVVILGILAISGLFVGVTNDAVNFLNSAIGSKAAPKRMILAVASIGIIIGVLTSSGMMEVARSGMFNPGMFTFHEVMILYLGVMFANIILLDLYNSLGLPTSTTVSLIFCLLGSAIAVSIFKISSDPAVSLASIGEYINTTRAMGIVSAILLSVVIAFTCGTIVMYISRTIFSFRYSAMLRRFGAFWCGASLTAILYFALFKGLKNLLSDHPFTQWVSEHLLLSLGICWVACSLILLFVQLFRVNILRITILAGTFALALAFAGNDLVNFIGVPVASFDAYKIASEAGSTTMLMGALSADIPANMSYLLIAGGVMLLTLWTSKKAMHVSQTELKLAASKEEEDTSQNNSSVFSRTIVRAAMQISNGLNYITPKGLRRRIDRRFEYEDIEHSGAPFDMIRATVNLTTSALLIALATSLKLPLSTTYVCFMVAMGSSLADRAWGRESAVYRISGVITVVMGWFVTALGGFLIAFVVGLILIYGGTVAFVVVTILCAYMLIRSNFSKKKGAEAVAEERATTNEDVIRQLREEVEHTMLKATKIYDRTMIATMRENRSELQAMVKEANNLFYQSRERKYTLMPTLKRLQHADIYAAHYYVQVVDYLNEVTKALLHIARPAFDHIDNCHEGFTSDETRDLMAINDEVEMINRRINTMLREGKFAEIETVLLMRDGLFERISEAMLAELSRIDSSKTSTRASMLYLTILSETKNMVLQSRNLLKSQQYFLQHQEEKEH